MSRIAASILPLVLATATAHAEPTVKIAPTTVHAGEPVLITVTDAAAPPRGTANGTPLAFVRAKHGYQAVFAVPLAAGEPGKPDAVTVKLDGLPAPAPIAIAPTTFGETSVIVEDELANPPPADRARIDADNAAILAAVAKGNGAPRFERAFTRPPGEVTSPYGEWRTFNDGHRSQHLGLDLFAREGSKVKAINAGTVVLVRDCLLAGTVVVIAHGGGIASAYYHLSKVNVREGDELAAGGVLGLAGHTGRTTGPHLHLSIRVPGGFVDPAGFFDLGKLGFAPAPTAVGAR
ncbi:MAG TPA: M23 family metallopeptidase [Kofleriaceae bacterium]|nr:M23 family metallopeptidase [Kofleriaceae bacterium]